MVQILHSQPVMPSPTQRLGAEIETIVEAHLIQMGYRMVARNWRVPRGEIDRVAWDGGLLCFIEVRGRATGAFGQPGATVDRRKQKRLVRTAMEYVVKHHPRTVPMIRFDVVSVIDRGDKTPEIVVIQNAFDAASAGPVAL